MSVNLNAPALVGGQATPETTVNDAVGVLDAAITEDLVINLTLDVTLTSAQYRGAVRFAVTTTGATKTLTLPAVQRFAFLTNDGTLAITVAKGTTNFSLAVGGAVIIYTDGTANGLVYWAISSSAAPVPYDLGVFVPDAPTNSMLCLRFNVVRAFTWPINLTDSRATAGTASTGTVAFTLKRNGVSMGTITFTTSATGVFAFAAAITFAVADVIEITAPATADATLANIAINFKGTR